MDAKFLLGGRGYLFIKGLTEKMWAEHKDLDFQSTWAHNSAWCHPVYRPEFTSTKKEKMAPSLLPGPLAGEQIKLT